MCEKYTVKRITFSAFFVKTGFFLNKILPNASELCLVLKSVLEIDLKTPKIMFIVQHYWMKGFVCELHAAAIVPHVLMLVCKQSML